MCELSLKKLFFILFFIFFWTPKYIKIDQKILSMSPSSPSKYFHVRNIDGTKTNFAAFKILENDGNGDCLFMSIMQFLEHNDEIMYELPRDVTELRHEIVNYISHSSNWNRFTDTIQFNLESLLPIMGKTDYPEIFRSRAYSHYMKQQRQYGTFAELQAASEIFDFVYVVFRKEQRRSESGSYETWYNCFSSSEDHTFKSKMFLFFSGMPSSGHFQFMQPIFPKRNLVILQGDYKTNDEHYSSDNSYSVLSVKKVHHHRRA